MEKLAQLCQDVVQLWDKYHVMYLNGIKNTLILALVATVIGCLTLTSRAHFTTLFNNGRLRSPNPLLVGSL